MARGAFLCVILVLALAGCTSTVQMANGKGQMVQCSTTSFGLLATLIAESMRETCVDNYEKQGFHQEPAMASPQPVASPQPAAPTGQTKQQ
jgi:hypothetical protein